MMPANMELTIPAGTTCSSGYSSAASTPPDFNWETFLNELSSLETSDGPEAANSYNLSLEPHGDLMTHRNCTFYISNDDPAIQMINFGAENNKDLYFVIVGPTGHHYPVTQLTALSDRIACTFRPLLPGMYLLSVFYRNQFHISGSPSHLFISRDYKTLDRAIVSLDIELIQSPHHGQPSMDIRKPWGISSNTKTEQLLVADRQKHEILVYGPDGEFNFKFGTPGVAVGEFCRPTGIAYDAVGDRILVTDKDNHRVQIFSSRGEFLSTFGSKGTSNGQFKHPWGIAVSRDGAFIAVADTRNHRIQLFNAEGKFIRKFQVSSPKNWKDFRSVFDQPRGLAFSLNGDFLYVTDFNLHTVFRLDIEFQTFVPLMEKFLRPSGLAVDDVGNLIVCSTKDNSIKVLTPCGNLLHTHHSIGTTTLDQPTDIALMKAGFLATLDHNGRISII